MAYTRVIEVIIGLEPDGSSSRDIGSRGGCRGIVLVAANQLAGDIRDLRGFVRIGHYACMHPIVLTGPLFCQFSVLRTYCQSDVAAPLTMRSGSVSVEFV